MLIIILPNKLFLIRESNDALNSLLFIYKRNINLSLKTIARFDILREIARLRVTTAKYSSRNDTSVED